MDQPNEHISTPAVTPDKPNLFSDASADIETKQLDSSVDSFLRHRSVGGPFPASNSNQVGRGNINEMIPDEILAVRRRGISNKRPQARPRRKHIATSDFNIGREVADLQPSERADSPLHVRNTLTV